MPSSEILAPRSEGEQLEASSLMNFNFSFHQDAWWIGRRWCLLRSVHGGQKKRRRLKHLTLMYICCGQKSLESSSKVPNFHIFSTDPTATLTSKRCEPTQTKGVKKRCKTTRTKLEDDQQTTSMEKLPTDIVIDILLRLPITSLVQFKLVCRGWRVLSQNPHFAKIYLSTAFENDPCLILHCDFPIRNQLYFVDFSDEENNKKKDDNKVNKLNPPFQPKMQEFAVVGSCNGLLCLFDSLFNDAIYLYNPFTTTHVQLPKSIQYPDQEIVLGFGFHPKTKEYKVVKIVYYRKSRVQRSSLRKIYTQSEVQILTLGTSNWRSLGKVAYQLVRRESEALVNGRLHWISRPKRYHPARRIISFDLADEKFIEVSKPGCGGLNRCNYHLAVIKGCLSAGVYCNYGRLEIWVMKKYNVKESWVKEYSVGSYMPKELKQTLENPFKNWKIGGGGGCNGERGVRVLCEMKNGEIVLEYRNRVLACYDPKHGKFRDLFIKGIPSWFHTVVHVGSLNWIDTISIL